MSRRLNLVEAEELAHQAGIGAPSEFQPLNPVHGVELIGKRLGKSLHPRAARVDQRAVNIKKNQPHHATQA